MFWLYGVCPLPRRYIWTLLSLRRFIECSRLLYSVEIPLFKQAEGAYFFHSFTHVC